MEPTGLPSGNVQYLLFIVGYLGKVEGRVKLFKLHHLLQTEAKVKFDQPDEENELGYTQYDALQNCTSNSLISESVSPDFIRDRYDYQLTPQGHELYSELLQKLKKPQKVAIITILEKYRCASSTDLIRYTHKKYVDEFDSARTHALARDYTRAITTIQDIMFKLDESSNDSVRYLMVGELDHVKKILGVLLSSTVKKVQAGAVITATKELLETLTASTYRPDEAGEELFEYIDNYADKEGILPSISSDDFSNLTEADKTCLSKFLNRVNLPLSS